MYCALLSETPLSPNSLVVRLPAVGKAAKNAMAAALKIHSKPSNPGLANESLYLAVCKIEHRVRHMFRCVRPRNFYRTVNQFGEKLRLRIQVAPHHAWLIERVDDIRSKSTPFLDRVASCIIALFKRLRWFGNQRPWRRWRINDMLVHFDGRKVVPAGIKTDVSRASKKNTPRRQPFPETPFSVPFEAPVPRASAGVMDEKRRQHFDLPHNPQEFRLRAQLHKVIGGRRGSAAQAIRCVTEKLGDMGAHSAHHAL